MKGASILPLRLDGVSYDAAGKRLLDSISAELIAGPRTLILGPNGAGKSLLLRICHGLLQPSAGNVQWRGPASAAARRRQAMVFQRPVMLRRSVAANINYALKLRRLPRGDRAERVEQALERTGLATRARQPARALSGGEQQRLALARAWATRPEVLFLDEPTASLDPAATRAVVFIVAATHRAGTNIVMTTPDLGPAPRLGDEVLFLDHGRLVEQDSAERFFAGPRTEKAAAFLEGRLLW